MLRTAVAQKEDVNCRDEENRTALFWAVIGDHTSIVRHLLKQPGIDVNVKEDRGGQTVLHFAASIGHVEIVQLLLTSKSMNVNSTTKNGLFALISAAYHGHTTVVERAALER